MGVHRDHDDDPRKMMTAAEKISWIIAGGFAAASVYFFVMAIKELRKP